MNFYARSILSFHDRSKALAQIFITVKLCLEFIPCHVQNTESCSSNSSEHNEFYRPKLSWSSLRSWIIFDALVPHTRNVQTRRLPSWRLWLGCLIGPVYSNRKLPDEVLMRLSPIFFEEKDKSESCIVNFLLPSSLWLRKVFIFEGSGRFTFFVKYYRLRTSGVWETLYYGT